MGHQSRLHATEDTWEYCPALLSLNKHSFQAFMVCWLTENAETQSTLLLIKDKNFESPDKANFCIFWRKCKCCLPVMPQKHKSFSFVDKCLSSCKRGCFVHAVLCSQMHVKATHSQSRWYTVYIYIYIYIYYIYIYINLHFDKHTKSYRNSCSWFICTQDAYLSRLNLREWRMAGSFCLRFHKWMLSSAKALTSAPYGPNKQEHNKGLKSSTFVIPILNRLKIKYSTKSYRQCEGEG